MAKREAVFNAQARCNGVAVTKVFVCLLITLFFSACKPTGDLTLEGYSSTSPGVFATITPVAFGVVAAGNTDTQAIILTNNGGADMTLGTITNTALQLSAPLQLDAATTCVSGQVLKSTQSCRIVISFAATPVGVYTQTLKLDYHDGGLNHVLSVNLSGTARPIANNITPAAFDEDTQSGTITLNYSGGTNATTCALSSLSDVAVTQACNCVAGVCTLKVTGTANYFGAASFGYTVTANGVASNTATATLTVNSVNDNPVLTVPSNRLYPLDGSDEPILQGTQVTFTSSTTDVENDIITYSCTYTTPYLDVGDANYAAPATACTSLPSLITNNGVLLLGAATFSTATSALVWQPTNRQKGTYKFTITATDSGGGSDIENFSVTVREAFTTSNLLAAYDAAYSEGSPPTKPRLDGSADDNANSWLDLTMSDITASLAGFTTADPWAGVGIYNNPYRLTFNGTDDSMRVESVLGSSTKMMFSTWINPGKAMGKDKIILGNGGGSGDGFVLQQSRTATGKIELAVGRKKYADLVLSEQPVAYWRLNETNGSVAANSVSGGTNLTYSGNQTFGNVGTTGDVAAGLSAAALRYIASSASAPALPTGGSARSVEMWTRPNSYNAVGGGVAWGDGTGNQIFSIEITSISGTYYLFTDAVNSANNITLMSDEIPTLNAWSHVAFNATDTTWEYYLNGVKVKSGTFTVPINTVGTEVILGNRTDGYDLPYDGLMQDVAVYDYTMLPDQIMSHYAIGKGMFTPNYAEVILSDSPSVYYHFDESAGQPTVTDTMGNSDGTLTSVTLGVDGVVDNTAASFTKVPDSYITFPPPPGLGADHSVEMWIKPAEVNSAGTINMMLFDSGGGNNNAISVYNGGSGSIRLRSYTGVIMDSIYQFPTANVWYHIVVTRAAGVNSMYINGVLDSRQTLPVLAPIAPLYINRYGGALGYSGNTFIDEFAVYNYTLDANQIRSHYVAGKVRFDPNPVLASQPIHYWPLGEKSGVVATDLGANPNDGTYVNAPTLAVVGALTNSSDSAITVNGTSSYVTTTATVTLPLTVSISAWLKTTIGGQGSIFSNRSGNHATYFGVSGGAVFIFDNQTGGLSGGSGINNGLWHHIVWTANGTTSKFYVDGSLVQTAAFNRTASAATLANFGRDPELNEYFNGSIDELAIFDHVLTAREVADIYNFGAAWKCLSQTTFTDSTWKFLSGLWDGTELSLFVNGREECKITPSGMTFSPGLSANTYMGATPSNSKNWQGSVADIKIYGTSGTGSAGSTSVIKNDFNATGNSYREQPVEAIVTSGLVFHLDAANANQGLSPFTNGCAATELTWFDFSTSDLLGTLKNFSGCGAASGWTGNGTAANPYSLTFDGVNDYVDFGNVSSLNMGTNSWTAEAWFKTSGGDTDAGFIGKSLYGSQFGRWTLYMDTGKIGAIMESGATVVAQTAGTYNDNNWHHILAVWDRSALLTVYVDGTVQATADISPYAAANMANPSTVLIGRYQDTTGVAPHATFGIFTGDIPIVRVYNRTLSLNEIKQNCHAQKARFSGATCAAP